ncbi:pectinesterase family protein [Arabidopsis lyrata subsp. lyrata]|uniref:Pectinesterase n=1 Tax=Arabidopsis lyrata subsp. lyrata TaxID=81972 RepID=D7LDI1_ARALL|nr:probable pectinesterase/pectinesterase inhibitor 12 [Arabidopsis lyrata subsp. lyrata]EFH55220.1 pectinesterase family protein [Arabidopsis lyrata subsp. lyrata]|eukprot:XP_002878961.1 probable pectinesterase/pectinesterase inhibitor 12 [Arabidopsis lyrata subsp. lyrata]
MALSTLNFSFLFFLLFTPLVVSTSLKPNQTSLTSFCMNTPYPNACFDSLKLSISINISPNILSFLLQTLQTALSEAGKLTDLLSGAGISNNLVEGQRGSLQDCKDLHQITSSFLKRSISKIQDGVNDSRKLADARAYLSAALTNKITCLEGLDTASGPLKPKLVTSFMETYKHVSNSLSALPKQRRATNLKTDGKTKNRRLFGLLPDWVSKKDHRFLEDSSDGYDEYDPSEIIVVAADGTGNFSTINEAISFAPDMSNDRVLIYVREGVYDENIEIPIYKTNIVLIGDGSDVTFITGNRSVGDGWTTFRSATLAVSGEGFLARDMMITNTAGPEKHQAVALRVNADFVALYRCVIDGYQDTLYTHSFRQFYRECDIYGTIDYIFGNAAVVFQGCNIVSKLPMPGQFTVVTAQSRDSPDEDTGISMQNCSILASDDLFNSSNRVKSYLGRPWREFSRTVLMESYIDEFIDGSGWSKWNGREELDTLYYGEYNNNGPGSETGKRVNWPGFHIMGYEDAFNFTTTEFITGDGWLGSTSFPYDNGI